MNHLVRQDALAQMRGVVDFDWKVVHKNNDALHAQNSLHPGRVDTQGNPEPARFALKTRFNPT